MIRAVANQGHSGINTFPAAPANDFIHLVNTPR